MPDWLTAVSKVTPAGPGEGDFPNPRMAKLFPVNNQKDHFSNRDPPLLRPGQLVTLLKFERIITGLTNSGYGK